MSIGGLQQRSAKRARPFRLRGADVEMRSLSIVAHEKRATVLEPAVQVDHRNPRAGRSRHDAITRLKDEAARFHRRDFATTGRQSTLFSPSPPRKRGREACETPSMTATVVAIFAIVYLGMILGGLPFLQLDRTGVALLGA